METRRLDSWRGAGVSRLREFLEAARLRGVPWALRALSRRFLLSYRQAYLFWNPFGMPTEPVAEDSLEYRLATRDDLDRLAAFEPYAVRSQIRRWLESDDTWVFLALDHDRPVAFECNSTAAPPDSVLPAIVLEKHQIWTHEIYVVPEYRRLGVSLRLRRYRNQVVRAWGFGEIVSKVDADNYASLKRTSSLLGPGARVQRVTCLNVLGLRSRWVDKDARQTLEQHLARVERGGSAARQGPQPPACHVSVRQQ